MSISCTRLHVRNNIDLANDEPSFISEQSFVRAPLNSRVRVGIRGSQTQTKVSGVTLRAGTTKLGAGGDAKGKGKVESLLNVPVEIQEAMILEDLLFVLMVSKKSSLTMFTLRMAV